MGETERRSSREYDCHHGTRMDGLRPIRGHGGSAEAEGRCQKDDERGNT